MQLHSDILKACGLDGAEIRPVAGGDINQAFCLAHKGEHYFMKINGAGRHPGMFEKEANALRIMKSKTRLCIPEVIRVGEAAGKQYLLLEWLEPQSKRSDFWRQFGEGLAVLHGQTQAGFGWTEDNYIGSLPQSNAAADTWSMFYAEQRILPLVKKLCDQGQITTQDMRLAETLCAKLDELFPKEPPALLHGDLWSGNFMSSAKGPAIYDPAAYYGHREMDLGMSLLFGGFAEAFYKAYDHARPLEKDWRQRVPLTQLYPLLVHACLFGGHYGSSARNVMLQFGK